jgi:DNA-binding response OmpR family regulator
MNLRGFKILLLEDEMLLMLDIKAMVEERGAQLHWSRSVQEASRLLDEVEISAAILDYVVVDGTADELCKELRKKEIPFSIYSGYDLRANGCRAELTVSKPASECELQSMLDTLCAAVSN